MSDLSITAANVVPGSNARIDRTGYAGETITAGQGVVRNSSNVWVKADSNSATAALRAATGIALNGASQYQPIDVQTDGDLTTGATMTANTTYYGSDTPGGICPLADVGTGEYLQIMYVALTTTTARLVLKSTGVAN